METRHYNTVPRMDRVQGWVPARFAAQRVASGLTWQALADQTGVPISTLYRWSDSGAPPHHMLRPLLKALGCSATKLIK